LPEVLGQVYAVGAGSKQVDQEYHKLLNGLGPELRILLETPLEEIRQIGGEQLAQGIDRMRRGEVDAQGGYDGEYGVIRLFSAAPWTPAAQMDLFGNEEIDTTQEAGSVRDRPEQEIIYGRAPRAETAPFYTIQPPPTPHVSRFTPPISHLLDGLNPEQAAAVQTVDAPLVIMAGPGTGKTRTLTVRIAWLIKTLGVAPEAILAITFTNKAAGEMQERLAGLLGEAVAGRVLIRTFHAFGAMLLREHGQRLGLDRQFTIVSDEDRRTLLKLAQPDLKQNEIDQALALISHAKNLLLTPDSLESSAEFPQFPQSPQLPSLFRTYQAALRASQSVDFDDLLLLPVQLLESHADLLDAIQQRYRWLSVDEYQDVNQAQYRLLRLLAGGGANLCVIGDPDQAIYGFRGADRRFFLDFLTDYPGAVRVQLTRNYRSLRAILDAAQQVIAHNAGRDELPLLASFAAAVRLDVHPAPTEKAEAETIVHQIEQMVGGTSYFSLDSGRSDGLSPVSRDFGDFAVLYRLGAQAAPLVEAFDRSGIPYQVVGQASFWASKPARRVLAWLWLVENPRSALHLTQILADAGAGDPATDAARVIESLATANDLPAALAWLAAEAPALTRRRIEKLAACWQALPTAAPVVELLTQVCDFLSIEAELRARMIQRAQPFGDRRREFLETVLLERESDNYDPRADRVALMTLHAAKGLEFPVVFIAGCEEGLLPYMRNDDPPDIEEERRLFYVGMTRAQEKLILSHARRRILFGRRREPQASRFVGEIAAALLELQRRPVFTPEERPAAEQLGLF